MKPPVVHNRLEDSNLKAVIGPDGVEVGGNVTYPSVKFGNGVYSASAGQGAKFESFNAGTRFTISFWTVITRHSRPQPLFDIIGTNINADLPALEFSYLGHLGTNRFQFNLWPATSSRISQQYWDYAFTDGIPFHFRIEIDNTGTNQSERQRIFIDGIEITTFTSVTDTTTQTDWDNVSDYDSIGIAHAGRVPSWFGEAVDNLKIYDYIMNDENGRYNERFGLNDQY